MALVARLAHDLEHLAAELGQLVEQQGPAMRQRKLARLGPADPAADQPGRADRVVGRADGALPDQRALGSRPATE